MSFSLRKPNTLTLYPYVSLYQKMNPIMIRRMKFWFQMPPMTFISGFALSHTQIQVVMKQCKHLSLHSPRNSFGLHNLQT